MKPIDTCNVSNPWRPFPCFSLKQPECYDLNQTCNGILDCYTGVDEMNCPETSVGSMIQQVAYKPRPPIEVFKRLWRHYIDGEWFWRSYYIKSAFFPSSFTSLQLVEVIITLPFWRYRLSPFQHRDRIAGRSSTAPASTSA